MSKPLVSIIVLNWNGDRFVDDICNSIASQSYPKDKIEFLFVDNNSSDESVSHFKSKNIPYAKLIQTGHNYGYSGGNNYGFRAAKGDYIAVCNNDLRLTPSWLDELVKAAIETNADVVVPKLVYGESHKINNAGSMICPNSDWPNQERGMDKPINSPEFNKQQEVTAFCGASPLFKRSFLEEVGLFDKKFFLYWEDVDLSWRGQKKGKKYVYEPKAVAYHYTSGSTGGEQSPIFIYYVSRNRLLVLIKHSSPRLIIKGFMKVFRDHVLYKIRDLYNSIKTRSNRIDSFKALLRGVKIILAALSLSPLMLSKRWGIVKEETI